MQLTRYVLAGALAMALAIGGATVAFAADAPGNRGWSAPVGAADEFADRSE
ncbi:hypothetical protein GCM10017691_28650 [Pseudonocardia petroleophila]|uniref:Uncharacterized protein n=1 Tax=Pseudonocardia petroleophila TaxID=37331 RepID=A0A7G7MEP4_9PSEU|nr:hypothetical protein [Pseudonocardia petroleophila]QNG51255.1 hypothetical protein H6H00_24370 [Pseudonocardia petroleophila]